MKKKKRFYIVGSIEKKVDVNVKNNIFHNTSTHEIDLSWADGMFGMCAVFTNKRKAEKYANGAPLIVMYGSKKDNNEQ